MKLAKRILTAGVALALTLGLNIPAFAATITVNNAVEGQTYTAYKLFDVTSSDPNSTPDDTTDDNYAYSISSSTTLFTQLQTALSASGALNGIGLSLQESSTDGIYNVIASNEFTTEDAKTLSEWVTTNLNSLNLGQGTTATIDSATDIATFNLEQPGYYYVTSSVGSLCILNTTDSSATINEKNEEPTVEKKVDATDPDTAQVGDVLNFKVTINAQPGAENYVLHDKMSDGLTLINDDQHQIVVTAVPATGGDPVTLTVGAQNDYTVVTTDSADDCDLEIRFTQTYLDSIDVDTTITISYYALLNEYAVTDITNPETNEAVLKYGHDGEIETTPVETKTYTYGFDLDKVDAKGNAPLPGAEFSLYSQEEGGAPISLVDLGNGSYRVADGDDATTTTTIVVNSNGEATVTGLAGKDYWLEETKAPAGYNMLTKRQLVDFTDAENPADGSFADVTVQNNAGSLLPSTGGMGTTILYIAGAALVLGAGVTLVVRRRMNSDR